MLENPDFLKKQLITYLGNKRALLGFIDEALMGVKSELKKEKISFLDLFSGSGVVARFAKAHCDYIIANDLEYYSYLINKCFLANKTQALESELKINLVFLENELKKGARPGFISELYAAKDEENIQKDDRLFYTKENALFLDTALPLIKSLPPKMQPFFMGPLLSKASIHANTAGVFKGFYKDAKSLPAFGGEGKHALSRILGKISLELPILSNFACKSLATQRDANALAGELDTVDVAYLDPPYNQHPYASNYFMLNLLAKYERPEEISKVSGIAKGWNKSVYNAKHLAVAAFFDLASKLKAKYLIISYNDEGFIKREQFESELQKLGRLTLMEKDYYTYRASRNLKDRNIHLKELLFILKKA